MPEVRIEMATTTEIEDVERPSRAVSTRVRYGILGVIVIATAINYMDRANLSIVAPDVKKDLHISAAELGIIFSAFSWTYAALQIPGGWVLDRVGPRITFGIALIFWSIVTGSISLAKGFGSLLGLRLALGVAETPAFPRQQCAGQQVVPDQGAWLRHGRIYRWRVCRAGHRRSPPGLDGGYVRVAFGVLPDRYYSSGSLHGLMANRPLTLPYHMQQHVSHDMRPALTRENAWMITNRDCSTGPARSPGPADRRPLPDGSDDQPGNHRLPDPSHPARGPVRHLVL